MFAQDDLLELASIEVADDDLPHDVSFGVQQPQEDEAKPMGPEELKEYLRRLDPEDFGRFKP